MYCHPRNLQRVTDRHKGRPSTSIGRIETYWPDHSHENGNRRERTVLWGKVAIICSRRKRCHMGIIMKLAIGSVLCGTLMLTGSHGLHASERNRASVASGRSHGLSILIVNDSEKFVAGRNSFCVTFTGAANGKAEPVKDVEVEFAQQVGKIRERPIHAHVAETDIGHFCSTVDFGTQYYDPGFYYAYIRYADTSGTKRKSILTFAIKRKER